MSQKYRLYARRKGHQKRFHPVDWTTGLQVRSLIRATLFYKSEALLALSQSEQQNGDVYDFKLVEVSSHES